MPRKYLAFITIISGVLIALGVGIILKSDLSQKSGTLNIRKTMHIETVSTQDQIVRGLSGRESLADDSAMLFVFPDMKERCFWMKEMRFSIDIVWLDQDKRVTAVEKNVSPDTFPKSFCHEGHYVLELPAHKTHELGLESGSLLRF